MNRWEKTRLLSVMTVLIGIFYGSAVAQTATRDFPPAALRGSLKIGAHPPEATLDGQATRLSPGSRIHGLNNLLISPAGIAGQSLTVNYTLDNIGQIGEVWILSETEARVSRPDAAKQKATSTQRPLGSKYPGTAP